MGSINSFIGPREFSPGFEELAKAYGNTALLMGAGTATLPLTDNAVVDKNFMSWWLKTKAASGTTRGLYLRLYLSPASGNGAGGEAARFFTTVETNTPQDTVNGSHTSLSFGSSVGNITGLATAGRFTFHVPGRAINGTWAPVQSEIYGDAANGAVGGLASFLRMIVDGHANLKASFDTNGYLFDISGVTPATGKFAYVHTGTDPTNSAGSLRFKLNGTPYYFMFYAAEAA